MNMLQFEKNLYELREKIDELQKQGEKSGQDMTTEVKHFQKLADEYAEELYSNLTPSQKIQIARHSERPNFKDFVDRMTENFIEVHGDRVGTDDRAIVGGPCEIDGIPVMLIGTYKGKTTKEISKSNNDEISNKKIKISNNKKYDDDDDLDVAASLFEPKKDDYFDSILNNIQVNNTSKKKKKNTLAKSDLIRKRSCSKAENRTLLGMPKENAKINIDDLNISESEEFAFLNDLNHTRCTSKKTIDHSKMLNMNFLPKDLLYNESNYKESTQSILKTIDLVEKAQILHEEKIKGNVTKKKDNNKENKKGFWEDLFSTFKCGQCTSNN